MKNIETSENKSIDGGIKFTDFLNGGLFTREAISKQWTYFIFLGFLAMIYINNHYAVEKLLKEQVQINVELKELKYEAITTSSQLMQMSRQSEVLRHIEQANIGLGVLKTPPRILIIEK